MAADTIRFEIVVVGAGVIGLACARALAERNPTRRILILEREAAVGRGISSRNSEVIHAGLYYPLSYLRTAFCVRGRELLYQYCREQNIPHRNIGKLVVANTDEEHEFLHALAFRAELNGVHDLQWLDRARIAKLEPAVQAKGGFLSPSTGIVDSNALLRTLERDVASRGVSIALQTVVTRITREHQRLQLHCTDSTSSYVVDASIVINSAGLQATSLAHQIDGMRAGLVPEIKLAKGDYFSYTGKNPFSHLVYPVPHGQPARSPGVEHQSLGIHATIDMSNQLRFGPDIEYIEHEQYSVRADKREPFAQVIRNYFPALDADKLQPAWAGIRPRLVIPGKTVPDFMVQSCTQHGVNGLVNLFGIESPGLTSALALAEYVAALESLPVS